MLTAAAIADLAQAGMERVVAALGVFDGVHLGHRQVIAGVVDMAERLAADPVVVTFQPHPREVLFPEQAPALLTTDAQNSGEWFGSADYAAGFLELWGVN